MIFFHPNHGRKIARMNGKRKMKKGIMKNVECKFFHPNHGCNHLQMDDFLK
jgi:hypothetical protein